MQRVRVYLVRHGHVQYFEADGRPINPKFAPLSEQGIQQIQLLAEQLKAIAMDQIFASTMPRSIQTAEILAKQQAKQEIQCCDEIREIKSGRLKDIPFDQADVLIKKAYYPRRFALDGFLQGELWASFEARVTTWFQTMLLQQAKSQAQHVLVSAHDAVNRVLLNWVYGLQNHDVQVQEQHYAGLNIIDFYIENQQLQESRILLQNFTAHNILKINESENALDQVYNIFMKNNGFKGE